mmetsp:Transcript_18672/g.25752  ORF Transcript_18672/g.25752 Transcript_18672/m.25752 type:complete len:342 (+) Transcript_18672:284-1309(+)
MVNEMMLVKGDTSINIIVKFLELLIFVVGPVVVLQRFLLYYLEKDITFECPSDNMELRLIVSAALVLHVIPSLRDVFIEYDVATLWGGSVIIDVNDDLRIQKRLKLRPLASIASLFIVFVEFLIIMFVLQHAISSVMTAQTTDEIVGDGLASIFINEIDNMAYSLLVPESLRNLHAKQLFRLEERPSAEITETHSNSSFLQRLFHIDYFLLFLGIWYSAIRVGGIYTTHCSDKYNIFVIGMGDSSFVDPLISYSSASGCPVPIISSFRNYSFLPYFFQLNRTCAPSYGPWKDNIAVALLTGRDDDNEFEMISITLVWLIICIGCLFVAMWVIFGWAIDYIF